MIHRLRRSATGSSVLLFTLILALAGLLVYSIARFDQLQERLAVSFPENRVWNAVQAEIELTRFIEALTLHGAGRPEADALHVLERFEVLWSRIGLYREGSLVAAVADAPLHHEVVRDLVATLEWADPLLPALRHGDLGGAMAMRARFEPFAGRLREMSIADLLDDTRRQDSLRLVHLDVTRQVLVFVVLFLVAAALAAAASLRSTWQTHRLLQVTERARLNVERSRTRLRQAIESINEGFALYDAQDRLVLCNERYRSLYQSPGDAPAKARRHDGQPVATEDRLPDGRWFLASDRATDDGGSVSVRTDITELKQRELELTQAKARLEAQAEAMRGLAEAAQQASEAKSRFLATMSHEIRTPMNAVLGILGLLDDAPLAAEEKRLIGVARGSAEALLGILNDILDVSRIEAGQLQLQRVVFAPADLARSVAGLWSAQAETKGLELVVDVADDVPRWVRGDVGRIRQMLQNYVNNAVKFTDAGKVALSVAWRPDGAGPRRLRFCVTDTGPGLPEGRTGDLFRDFSQLDGSIARRHGGTGLGLAITKRLAEMMDGEVGFASRPGSGSCFWFDLPLAEVSAPAPVEATAHDGLLRTTTGGRPLVLVVDDNATNRLVARALLDKLGCRTELANDGAEAIAAVGRQRFDGILMDISMPVMDGLEATRRLRSQGVDTPIIALTAHAGAGDAQRFLATGMDGCLFKPVSKSALAKAFAEVFAGRAAVQQRLQEERNGQPPGAAVGTLPVSWRPRSSPQRSLAEGTSEPARAG